MLIRELCGGPRPVCCALNVVMFRLYADVDTDVVVPLRSVLTGLMYDKLLKVHSSSEPPEAVSLSHIS